MLTVVTGRSRRLWPHVLEQIGRAHAAGAERILLITPDQYTLQAELDLVDTLNLPGLLQIEVLSPSRLMTRVFSVAGSPQRVRIDARGKAMVLADLLRESAGLLRYFQSAAERRGFAEQLSASIGDFKRAGMRPEDVVALAEALNEGDALRLKLSDIALLYGKYEERLEGVFLDGEDAQEALLDRLPESGILKGALVWVYGFDLITPQFMRQLAVMAREAASVELAMTAGHESAGDGMVFAAVHDAIAMLARHMDRERLLWESRYIDAPLHVPEDIAWLEQTLFSVPTKERKGAPPSITRSVAVNPYDEAMRAAATILDCARAGMPMEAIAVVVGNADDYIGAIETAFGRSGIPFHMTRKRPALSHPLIRSWLAALRTVSTQWRYREDALDWLKGGFSGLTIEEAEQLENYAIEHGLRGAKWQRTIDDPELEALRQRFTGPLRKLQEGLRKARNHTASLTALYGLLEDTAAYDTLTAWQQTLTARGHLAAAAECSQVWRLLLETLDQLHTLLDGSRLRMEGLARVVEAGFAAAELTVVPPSPGMVRIDELGHAKIGSDCSVLFLLGMQDGVLRAETPKLLSDREATSLLEKGGAEGAFGLRGEALGQLIQLNLLDTIAAPDTHLYISHCASGVRGEALRPAAWLTLLRRVFPGLVEQGSAVLAESIGHAPGAAIDAMGAMIRAAAERGGFVGEEAEIVSWLYQFPKTRGDVERVFRALLPPPPKSRLGAMIAGRLYAHLGTSVSRLETFAGCPFQHFVSYGLRPARRNPFEVRPEDTGSYFHFAMEGYARLALGDPAWPDITREESDALMERALLPLREAWKETPMYEGAMQRAASEAICRVARRTAWNYARQMRSGGFRTERVEARFGPGEALPPIVLSLMNGDVRYLQGRIDRIDLGLEDGLRFMRIVDYKTGGTTLDLSRVYGGLQLQLLLYLSAAFAAMPQIEPAGAGYARFEDPYVETDSDDVHEIEALIAKAMRLKGVVLSDVRVIRALEDGESYLNKDGSIKNRKSSLFFSREGMDALMCHAKTMAEGLAGGIAAGEIVPRPARLSEWKACAWCEYHTICGFDPSLNGHEYRNLEKISRQMLLERLGVVDDDPA